jgi:dTDP-4-dehydrorhamnose 3,5-epimerase
MIKKIYKTRFPELRLFSIQNFSDNRGFFEEIFNKREFRDKLKISFETKMICSSFSKKNVIRGFHYQIKKPINQMVYVQKGKILDVVVDIRRNSKTFGQFESFVLSENNKKVLFMPKGFAHGFCAIEKENLITYNQSEFFSKKYDVGIRWNDPVINFNWPIKKPIISKKDANLPLLNDAKF